MEDDRNGNTAILTVIGVATLIVALVGATFAYFSATVSNDEAQSITVITANPTGLIYEGKSLTLLNATPGDSTSSNDSDAKFYVENPSGNTLNQKYDLVFKVDANNFRMEHILTDDPDDTTAEGTEQPNQLVATFSGISSDRDNDPVISVDTIDFTDGLDAQKETTSTTIVQQQEIAPGERHTYTAILEFRRLDTNQDENKDKSFSGHIEIANTHTVSAN